MFPALYLIHYLGFTEYEKSLRTQPLKLHLCKCVWFFWVTSPKIRCNSSQATPSKTEPPLGISKKNWKEGLKKKVNNGRDCDFEMVIMNSFGDWTSKLCLKNSNPAGFGITTKFWTPEACWTFPWLADFFRGKFFQTNLQTGAGVLDNWKMLDAFCNLQ